MLPMRRARRRPGRPSSRQSPTGPFPARMPMGCLRAWRRVIGVAAALGLVLGRGAASMALVASGSITPPLRPAATPDLEEEAGRVDQTEERSHWLRSSIFTQPHLQTRARVSGD